LVVIDIDVVAGISRVECHLCTCGILTTALPAWFWSRRQVMGQTKSKDAGIPSTLSKSRFAYLLSCLTVFTLCIVALSQLWFFTTVIFITLSVGWRWGYLDVKCTY